MFEWVCFSGNIHTGPKYYWLATSIVNEIIYQLTQAGRTQEQIDATLQRNVVPPQEHVEEEVARQTSRFSNMQASLAALQAWQPPLEP